MVFPHGYQKFSSDDTEQTPISSQSSLKFGLCGFFCKPCFSFHTATEFSSDDTEQTPISSLQTCKPCFSFPHRYQKFSSDDTEQTPISSQSSQTVNRVSVSHTATRSSHLMIQNRHQYHLNHHKLFPHGYQKFSSDDTEQTPISSQSSQTVNRVSVSHTATRSSHLMIQNRHQYHLNHHKLFPHGYQKFSSDDTEQTPISSQSSQTVNRVSVSHTATRSSHLMIQNRHHYHHSHHKLLRPKSMNKHHKINIIKITSCIKTLSSGNEPAWAMMPVRRLELLTPEEITDWI
ncbi:hypothetical protein J6590_037530 [Homalodisca vitripennis]|nr:hypothetical protein J6590_037530 [Homalodisca vitripennis]